jgi:hypothetical protein
MKKSSSQSGFTLLVALLVASVLLGLALSIGDILIKEDSLALAGRASHQAFYAADAGVECALYWDIKYSAFATSSATSINCNQDSNNQNNTFSVGGGGAAGPTSSFAMTFNPLSACALVTVTKNANGSTNVTANGFSVHDTGSPNCSSSSLNQVERVIQVSY